jgi:hypothetical protein
MSRIFPGRTTQSPTGAVLLCLLLAGAPLVAVAQTSSGQVGVGAAQAPTTQIKANDPLNYQEMKDFEDETKEGTKFVRQADAYEAAAEAASYLAHYMKNYSEFSQHMYKMEEKDGKMVRTIDEKNRFKTAVQNCVVEQNAACDEKTKKEMLTALVHYNLGREVRAMLLESNTYHQNMRSLESNREAMEKTALSKGFGRKKSTFQVDPSKVMDPVSWQQGKLTQNEIAVLGDQFLNDYRIFIDAYGKTVQEDARRYYQARKPARELSSEEEANLDDANHSVIAESNEAGPRALFDEKNFDHARRTQSERVVSEEVERIKKEAQAPKVLKMENGDFGVDMKDDGLLLGIQKKIETGDGNPPKTDPGEIAALTAVQMNRDINEVEIEGEKKNPQKQVQVQVNVAAFDAFLDEIWPPSAAKKPGQY